MSIKEYIHKTKNIVIQFKKCYLYVYRDTYLCVQVHMYTHACLCVGRGQLLVSFLRRCPPGLFRQGLSTEDVHRGDWVDCPETLGLPVSAPLALGS